jgi:phage shock protein PspC (stress-responsive transcriptional regulator)
MRIVWLCAAIFTGGIGFVAYLVCWMIMPKDYGPPVGEPAPAASQTTASAD